MAYDPAYGYEIAHIVQDGLRRMYGDDPENVIYYLTVYNEPIVQPAEPEDVDVEGILRGHLPAGAGAADGWRRRPRGRSCSPPASACRGRSRRSSCCAEDWGVAADVWSVTSWNELRRDGLAADEQAFLHPERASSGCRTSPSSLQDAPGPVVAVTDYMRRCRTRSAQWVPGDFASLGADGFGFSDTRPAARRFFHIDGPSIVVRTLQMLAKRGEVDADVRPPRRPSSTGCTT